MTVLLILLAGMTMAYQAENYERNKLVKQEVYAKPNQTSIDFEERRNRRNSNFPN